MSKEEFRKHPAVLIFSAECDGVRGELGVLIWRLIAPASDKRYIDLAEAEGGREGGYTTSGCLHNNPGLTINYHNTVSHVNTALYINTSTHCSVYVPVFLSILLLGGPTDR